MSFNSVVSKTAAHARAFVEEFVRNTKRGYRLNQAFREEARMLGHEAVEDEDLLLGILRVEKDGVASQALSSLGVTYEVIREQAKKLHLDTPEETNFGAEEKFGRRPEGERSMPISPMAQKALDGNVDEARRVGDYPVGDYPKHADEHLLLSILRNTDGNALRILSDLGAPAGEIEELLDQIRGRKLSRQG